MMGQGEYHLTGLSLGLQKFQLLCFQTKDKPWRRILICTTEQLAELQKENEQAKEGYHLDLSNLKLKYPINAAVATVFESELDKALQYANLSALHDEPFPINAPNPELALEHDYDVGLCMSNCLCNCMPQLCKIVQNINS